MLGAGRYQNILSNFQNKNSMVIHIEEASDESKALIVSQEKIRENKNGGEISPQSSPFSPNQNTPSKVSLVGASQQEGPSHIAAHEQPQDEGNTTLIVTLWRTSASNEKSQQEIESEFKIPLEVLQGGQKKRIDNPEVDSVFEENRPQPALNAEAKRGLYLLRGALVNLNKKEQDFFFRASKDFSSILLGSENHIHLWRRQGVSFKLEGQAPIDTGAKIDSIAFLGKNNWFAAGGRDERLRIYSEAGNLVQNLEAHSLRVSSCSSSPEGDLIVTGSTDLSLKIWSFEEPKKGKEQQQGQYSLKHELGMIHRSGVGAISLSKDCKLLISSSQSEAVIFAKKECSDGYFEVQRRDEGFSQIFISEDGKSVVTRGYSARRGRATGKVKLWKVSKKKLSLMYTLVESTQIAISTKNFKALFYLQEQAGLREDGPISQQQLALQLGSIQFSTYPKIEQDLETEKHLLKLFEKKKISLTRTALPL